VGLSYHVAPQMQDAIRATAVNMVTKLEVELNMGQISWKETEKSKAPFEKSPLPKIRLGELDAMDGSIAKSLYGIVFDTGMTLDEYRAERLSKYTKTNA
jgi:hypothetical protein